MWRIGHLTWFFFSRELSRLHNICFVSPSFSACSSACEISSLGWAGLRRPRSKSPHSTQSKNASKPEFYLGEKLGMVGLSSWFKTKILQSKGSIVFSTEKSSCSGAGWSRRSHLADTGLSHRSHCVQKHDFNHLSQIYNTFLSGSINKYSLQYSVLWKPM